LGYFEKVTKNGKITGSIFDENDQEAYEIFGNCSKEIFYREINSEAETCKIWHFPKQPKNWEEMYSFTDFTLQLNILTDNMKERLPPTDWRFRPDQRFLEEGDLDQASAQKFRLEEKQRRRRNRNAELKFEPKPVYFNEEKDNDGTITYVYNEKYWKDRQEGNWNHLPDLFGPDTPENSNSE
jgi:hypothetical protein